MIGSLVLPVIYIAIGVSVGVKCGAAIVQYMRDDDERLGLRYGDGNSTDPLDWCMAGFVALFAAVIWPVALAIYVFYRMVRREVEADDSHH